MNTVVYSIITVACTLCLLYKGRDLVRDPHNHLLRWLWAMILFVDIALFTEIPQVLRYLETTTGVAAVWFTAPTIAGCAASRSTQLLWLHPDESLSIKERVEDARRKIRIGLIFYAIAGIAVIGLSIAARGTISPADIRAHAETPEALYAATPLVRDAYLIYVASGIFTFAGTIVRLARAIKLIDRRWVWLRRGLRVLFHSTVLLLIYSVMCGAYFLAFRIDVTLPRAWWGVAMLAVGLGNVGLAVGVSLPALGPRWDRMRSYRRLEGLWLAVRRAAPDVVLEKPALLFMDAWNPWRSDIRLYRRVIEILDGLQLLRRYLDPDVAIAAERLGREASLLEPDLATTVLAAQLRRAVEDKHSGNTPGNRGALPVTTLDDRQGLDAELEALVPLADAFANSPIVQRAAAHGSAS